MFVVRARAMEIIGDIMISKVVRISTTGVAVTGNDAVD
jgi:hypothetical protein